MAKKTGKTMEKTRLIVQMGIVGIENIEKKTHRCPDRDGEGCDHYLALEGRCLWWREQAST